MELTSVIAHLLALLIGISLGLIGSGGSILTVPILVYILHIEPYLATAYSLFIVGSTAVVGAVKNFRQKQVDLKAVFFLGIPSLVTVFITRAFILPLIPSTIEILTFKLEKNVALMVLFSIVMFTSAYKMISTKKASSQQYDNTSQNNTALLIQGLIIGLIAGTVGAGGGFLIIPALVLLSNVPMKKAIGTSLFIIAIQSLLGFLGDLSHTSFDWNLLLGLTSISIIGIFVGMYLTKLIPDSNLKKGFGYFVLVLAIAIFTTEVFM